MRSFILICALWLASGLALAVPPVVENVQVQQLPGTFEVEITYDVYDAEGGLMDLTVLLSTDGGQTWPVRCDSLSGDFVQVSSGTGKSITWYAGGDYPGFQGDACRIRLLASDAYANPSVDFFRIVGLDTLPMAPLDTIGFGQPLTLMWRGHTPIASGMPLDILAEMDTIYPFDDGILGYKWRSPRENCIPALEDCWHPRRFNEATGDSFSYFGTGHSLTFHNDNSGTDIFSARLESGAFPLLVNARDIVQNEIPEFMQSFDFVVNYDPETYLLRGETDGAHPEDPQVYPYYTLLNDPQQTRYPFGPGETIPDRTYVVFKALFRDDPRDMLLDPDSVGMTTHFQAVRQNLTGGLFTFQSQASPVDMEPDWGAGLDGWYADTLGFMPAPHCDFQFFMQGVDEHGRRDGTPSQFSFSVGFPPCVQCVEILPGANAPSAFSPDLECYQPGETGHACFEGETAYYIKASGGAPQPGRTYLEQTGIAYLAIDRISLAAEFMETEPEPSLYYVVPCNTYDLSVLLHGRDDAREAWDEAAWRSLAWYYQVDYDCDPWNNIRDGGGVDNILQPTWGGDYDNDQLEILSDSGLWKLKVQVALPQMLINLGAATFLQVIQFTMADGDPELAAALYGICIRQLGDGMVRAVALDQTQCGYLPVARPARYHIFHTVRPAAGGPGSGTWRDCYAGWPELDYSLDLDQNGMRSNDGVPVVQSFQLILQDVTGADVTCTEPDATAIPEQQPWYEADSRQ